MEITSERDNQTTVALIPVRELDAGNAGELRQAIAPVLESSVSVVLDLSRLEFIDSSGLGAILSCLRQLTAKGGDLTLCGMTKQVHSAFEMVRMDRIFKIFETREQAIHFLAERTAGVSVGDQNSA